MAYQELIKNFNRIRRYMGDFYVYGFKSREDFTHKSLRSYDNERRRIESYLEEYMFFRQTPEGKQLFLSIDSRQVSHNPLYKAFKAKTFTQGDITLHFILLDILYSKDDHFTTSQIMEKIDQHYMAAFTCPLVFDLSTLRKKLNEYVDLGLFNKTGKGKEVHYSRASTCSLEHWGPALHFFSETAPLGVIGSFLLDHQPCSHSPFSFKHHYITQAMDSEILPSLFNAMEKQESVIILNTTRRKEEEKTQEIIPLKIFSSVQSGRSYVMAYTSFGSLLAYRLDYIVWVKAGNPCSFYQLCQQELQLLHPHLWGVATRRKNDNLESVTFTLSITEGQYIYQRLLREKRCGEVSLLTPEVAQFSALVCDSWEMVPWIRTFIGRILTISFSNKRVEAQFHNDLQKMYRLYDVAEDEKEAEI